MSSKTKRKLAQNDESDDDAPIEASSSIKVKSKKLKETFNVSIDPRFNPKCGEIDRIQLAKDYSFLQQRRKNEIKHYETELKDNPDLYNDKNFMKRLQSINDQYKTNQEKIDEANRSIQWHMEQRKAIKEGAKIKYKSKKEVQMEKQKLRFEQLKKEGRLEKAMRKRQKKLLAKDKKEGLI